MKGMGVRGILGIESPDPILSYLGGLGLALSAGTALVIDLEGGLRTARTLADFVESGPTLAEISPGRRGVALLSGGDVEPDLAADVVTTLARAWPAVVVRCPRGRYPWPTVPVRALLPGLLIPEGGGPTVWQPTRGGQAPPAPGPVLPSLPSRTARKLLLGRTTKRTRWIAAWDRVWEMPWA